MTTLIVRTQSFSAFHGEDRTVEHLLFGNYNTIAVYPFDDDDGIRKQLRAVELHGYAEVGVATALEIAAITDLKGGLNYPVVVPINMLNWAKPINMQQINNTAEFAGLMLEGLFGIKPKHMLTDTILLVDPHLMRSAAIDDVLDAAKGRRLIIFLPTSQVLPLKLMEAVQNGAEILRNDCRNVLLAQGMEEILMANERELDVEIMGAGDRLIPSIVGAADTCLHYVQFSGHMAFKLRAEYASQMVTYDPALCDFGHLVHGTPKFGDAITAYLNSQGIAATNSYRGRTMTTSKESFRSVRILEEV